LKISYGLRAFAIYFVILGSLIWFTLDNAIERLNDGMRQSAESVLVDMAHTIASFVEDDIDEKESLAVSRMQRVFDIIGQRNFNAKIYQVTKTNVDSQVYITDEKGIVIYDSSGVSLGADFSEWRDVRLTIDGDYGARTSYIDQDAREPDDPKAMIVAAPIRQQGKTVGVVSVVKPINSLEGHLLTETKQLQRYAFVLLALALLLGYLLSLWFTRSLHKIANYANDMADGKQVAPPALRDSRLATLTASISHMRSQLDGKEYVENYIHSLTHELKTPITGIRGAVELIDDDMPADDRARFLNNISTSNQRMSRLVDRMLSLAKLEGLTELVAKEEFDLVPTLKRLAQERSTMLHAGKIELSLPDVGHFLCVGDRVLLSQAIANLLDNAIGFSQLNGRVTVSLEVKDESYHVKLFNQGDPIPDFALAKLYDRFFSLPRPSDTAQSTKSTGLGLSFVREIMKLHNGRVAVANVEGGVSASLRWPIVAHLTDSSVS